MKTLLINFLLAFIASMLLTPLAGRLGARLGALDYPNARKKHRAPTPRTGGVAIMATFWAALIVHHWGLLPQLSGGFQCDRASSYLLAGAMIVSLTGLVDDFHRLSARAKFILQVVGVSVTYWGGVSIDLFLGASLSGFYGIPAYLATVFWFVLFINAVNLIDGLDGLAAGVTTFTCLVLAVFSAWRQQMPLAVCFAVLAGANLGFLRYNFNPATIFLGDGGSYFLGYMIAGLSILGSAKIELGATFLIPMLALGIPIFDTVFSPIRRFILGKKMFHPDHGHIHHKMVELGLSTRRVVFILYALSAALCAVSVILINLKDSRAGLLLVALLFLALVFVRKLGYFDYFATDKIIGWFKDVSDVTGLTHERRSFLNLQIEISKSADLDELWQNICRALQMLDFDMSEAHLKWSANGHGKTAGGAQPPASRGAGGGLSPSQGNATVGLQTFHLTWTIDGFDPVQDVCRECLLKLELPLVAQGRAAMGSLWLIKDLRRSTLSHYTLRRVEHLRRTITDTLPQLLDGCRRHPESAPDRAAANLAPPRLCPATPGEEACGNGRRGKNALNACHMPNLLDFHKGPR